MGVLPAVEPPFADPCREGGESESTTLWALPDVGVVAGVCAIEFLRDAFFDERVEEPAPTGTELPLPRLRFLMTSVFRESGRTTPWSLRKSPQALHNG